MEKPLKHFGIIGDVHAEDIALATTLDALRAMRVDAILCVGDIVDGVGSVDECCSLLQQHHVIAVRGNHERWFLGGTMRELSDANPVGSLSKATMAYLSSLPPTITLKTILGDLMLCHGLGRKDMACLTPDDYGYALEVNGDLHELLATGVKLVVGGHTHKRMVRRFDSTTIINAGTLKRNYHPCFGLINLVTRKVQFFNLDESTRWSEAESIELERERS